MRRPERTGKADLFGIAAPLQGATRGSMIDLLTVREREVLALILDGHALKEVARRLCLSQKTVGTHKRSIMKKLEAPNNVELVKIGIRQGLIFL